MIGLCGIKGADAITSARHTIGRPTSIPGFIVVANEGSYAYFHW
jgi:hypothetical protein